MFSTLVHALVCTRVDFVSFIYARPGLSSLNISNQKSILNAAAHLIVGFLKSAHISAFIWETLHPNSCVPAHHFKILTLVCNFLVGPAPSYLQTLCTSVSFLPSLSTPLPKAFTCAMWAPLHLWAPLAGTIFLSSFSSSAFLFFCQNYCCGNCV